MASIELAAARTHIIDRLASLAGRIASGTVSVQSFSERTDPSPIWPSARWDAFAPGLHHLVVTYAVGGPPIAEEAALLDWIERYPPKPKPLACCADCDHCAGKETYCCKLNAGTLCGECGYGQEVAG